MVNFLGTEISEERIAEIIAEMVSEPVEIEFDIINDEFTNTKILKIKKLGGEWGDKNIWLHPYESKHEFHFCFANIMGKDYITFECPRLTCTLNKGDSISFLFENGEILEYILDCSPEKKGVEYRRVILENKIQITISELETFKNENLKNFKLTSKNGKEILGNLHSHLLFTGYRQHVIKSVAQQYEQAVSKHIDNYHPIEIREIMDITTKGISRQIPQDVKDKVWNRDQGRCIRCGSNQNLEFDHIIPLSKGGANTYRNIQLLCETCNKKKSNKIG